MRPEPLRPKEPMSNASRSRRRRARSAADRAGKPPGTPIYHGEERSEPVHVHVLDYGPQHLEQREAFDALELRRYADPKSVSWINIDGIHQVEQVQAVCRAFDIHPLWVEDIVNSDTRPKAEYLGDRVFVVARMAEVDTGSLDTEQVSIIAGPGWVLTFQEHDGDVWQPLRARIEAGTGRVRTMRADYLLHALLDAIVDHYFVAIEEVEVRVDGMEAAALDPDTTVDLKEVFKIKNELTSFRRAAWPMREAVSSLLRDEEGPVTSEVVPFFRDLYDHVVQVMDILETSRERVVGVYELHLAVTSHRLNDIMKILTIVSTIFIPMTFVAGVYGMNFDNMPELHWDWGYPLSWLLMLGSGVGGALWMYSRKWV